MSSAATEIDFNTLPPYQKRTFLDEKVDLTNKDNVAKIYAQLLERKVESKDELVQWILDRSEFESALDQTGSIIYIRMTTQTDDESRSKLYQDFIESISPVVKSENDKLNKRYIELAEQFTLDQDEYGIYDREIRADIELFREDNIELSTKVELLSQEYQKTCGAMTVIFEGEEKTMPQMGKYSLETDRELREKAYRASAGRRLQDKDKLEEVFDSMLKLRNEIAQNADCLNFCDYKFKSLHRFDYTPEECKQYHTAVEEVVLPLYKKILEHRKEQLGVSTLRPWDLSVDPLGRDPLKPFEQVDKLIEGCHKMFDQVDPELGSQFKDMIDLGLLDLASRKGKAPGGYQSSLSEARKPFIFMNSVGLDGDVRTLLHEGGHAFHTIACTDFEINDYRHGPMEFNEVASMAMELLAGEYVSEFYNDTDRDRSNENHMEDIVFVLLWVANIDAFQHWIYENPNHTQQERKAKWIDLHDRFSGGMIDWSGLEEERSYLWHRQLHIFEVPFYYIEYGIAQLGALQVYRNAKENWKNAISLYREGLSLGGSRPLPEIYNRTGIKFDFTRETIVPLVDLIKEKLKYLL